MVAVILALYCKTLTVVSADNTIMATRSQHLCFDAFIIRPCHHTERYVLITTENETVKATYAESSVKSLPALFTTTGYIRSQTKK